MKQRIIGALVLVSLAVIFVPMIFDEPHSERQSTPITIPEEPPFPEVDMPAGQASGNSGFRPITEQEQAPSVVDSEVPQPDAGYRIVEQDSAPAAAAEAPVQPAQPPAPVASQQAPAPEPAQPQPAESTASASESTEQGEFSKTLEGAWVVQLGSFGNTDNARRLRDKVIEMDYGAHLQQLSRGGVELTRVFSGPFVSKAEAEKAKATLDKAFGLNSLVTSGGK